MQLVMFVGDDLVAALPVNRQRISWPGYISQLKRELMDRHRNSIDSSLPEPEFLLVPSYPLLLPPQQRDNF